MSEKLRFRILCWLANRLGFDLSEVTPEDLKPEKAEWYVWRELAVDGFRMTKKARPLHAAEIYGPYTESKAARLMNENNYT